VQPGSVSKIVLRLGDGNIVSPIKIAGAVATQEGAGMLIEWTAISEFQNAGFNILRRAVGTTKWERVNEALIAGRITAADPKSYRFYDWAAHGIFDYKLESVAINGDREDIS